MHVARNRLVHGEKISAESLAGIMEFGEANTGDRYFGLHRGSEFRLEGGGLLAYLGVCSETVEEVFNNLTRYVATSSDGFAIGSDRGEAAFRLMLHVSDPLWSSCNHLSEFVFARFLKCLRLITNSQMHPVEVQFAHARKEPDSECQRFFRCKVRFSRNIDAAEWTRSVLEMRIPTSDARLNLLLRKYGDRLLQQVKSKTDESFADEVTAAAARFLSSGNVSVRKVSRSLNVSERTMQRRLEQAGLSFNGLVRQLRQELAEAWLQTGKFDIKHISYMLGYSDVSAFSRAYKRWTGLSPTQGRGKVEPGIFSARTSQ
jgi:AraC-like DNA-binding protein